jgi:VCBS repeat-containing protein
MSVTPINSKLFKAVAASTTAIAGAQQLGGAGNMTLTGSSVNDGSNMDTTVTLTSTGNISGVTFTVTGTDASGSTITEDITGPNSNTVTGSTKFLTVTQIAADAAVGTDTSAGFSATTGTAGIVFAGGTRVRGLHGVSSSTAGALIIRNGSQSGTKLLEIDTPAAAGQVDPYIPDEGVRFKDGAYIDIGAGYDSVSIFFDG